VFFLDATDAQGAAVRTFDAPLTISVSYTPEQLAAAGLSEANLALFYYDEAQAQWLPVPTQVNSAQHTAVASVDHFTPFQLSDGSEASAAYVPTLQGFQVGLFTGAANYSIPIDVPAAAGGMKPDVSLSYSSSATDGSAGTRPKAQAS
jgi:hypothetical protein